MRLMTQLLKERGNKKSSYQTILCTAREALLLEFLYESFPDRSRKSIKSLLEQKQIMIRNEIVTRFDYPLAPGMGVIILKKKSSQNMTLRNLNLLYEDEHLLVIEKSAGLLSVATEKENEETAFSIMMFAKSKEIQQKLQDNWENAVTKRIYYAVVEGHVKNAEGEIVSCLKENKSLMVYSSKTPGDGQKAITRYRVLKSNARYSLLEVELETGRKNQIRVHLQDMGHSIAGDKKYGAVTDPLRRLGLHAGILEFFHPATGKCMHFETTVPVVLERLFE